MPKGPRYLDELQSEFLRQLRRAASGDVEAIHQLRVSGRRLRVVLPLLSDKPGGQRVRHLRRELRALIRKAGASRDRDVGLEQYQSCADIGQPRTRGQAVLHARLQLGARRARQRLAVALRGADAARLHMALLEQPGRCISSKAALARIEQLRDDYQAALDGELRALGRRFDPVGLHALRRRLRRLRYAAELQDHLCGRRSGAVARLKRPQTQLGDLRDQWQLAEWLQSLPGGRRQAGLVRRRARELHRAWLEGNPGQRLESALSAMRAPRRVAQGYFR